MMSVQTQRSYHPTMDHHQFSSSSSRSSVNSIPRHRRDDNENVEWNCETCTYRNKPLFLTCEMCGQPKLNKNAPCTSPSGPPLTSIMSHPSSVSTPSVHHVDAHDRGIQTTVERRSPMSDQQHHQHQRGIHMNEAARLDSIENTTNRSRRDTGSGSNMNRGQQQRNHRMMEDHSAPCNTHLTEGRQAEFRSPTGGNGTMSINRMDRSLPEFGARARPSVAAAATPAPADHRRRDPLASSIRDGGGEGGEGEKRGCPKRASSTRSTLRRDASQRCSTNNDSFSRRSLTPTRVRQHRRRVTTTDLPRFNTQINDNNVKEEPKSYKQPPQVIDDTITRLESPGDVNAIDMFSHDLLVAEPTTGLALAAASASSRQLQSDDELTSASNGIATCTSGSQRGGLAAAKGEGDEEEKPLQPSKPHPLVRSKSHNRGRMMDNVRKSKSFMSIISPNAADGDDEKVSPFGGLGSRANMMNNVRRNMSFNAATTTRSTVSTPLGEAYVVPLDPPGMDVFGDVVTSGDKKKKDGKKKVKGITKIFKAVKRLSKAKDDSGNNN